MITREKQPPNLEMPFSSVDGFITPANRFYVRCHFPIPTIDPATWRLRVDGEVSKAKQFSLADLRSFGSATITATLECAGNGRVFLVPKVKGVQWELGAVGNAQWTGVRLSEVLKAAGVREIAREVVLRGADRGTIAEFPRPGGEIHFARSIPLAKAIDDVLLAWEMNGEPLTPAHGFPLRAIVPGSYGMASVKWLEQITVLAEPFNGYYQTIDYAYWEPGPAGPTLAPLQQMRPKAQIAHPANGEVIPAGAPYRVTGAAWTGEGAIDKVEISFDNGKSWHDALLEGEALKNAWRIWSFAWSDPQVGRYTLLARATDSHGRTQPLERDRNFGTYVMDHCLPVEVEVR